MDLNRAATFLRVVESGGFTAAASVLGLPTSSVSRSIAKLEDELGVVLLERTTRRVSLTEVGRAYFERVREALAGLDEATAAALDAAREPAGPIRVVVLPDFAPVLAMPLAQFLRAYPKIRVEVATNARPAEQLDHADIAITFGKLPDSALVSRKLGATANLLYAAPSYLERRGRPRSVADLAHHDMMLHQPGSQRWELVGPRGVEDVEVTGAVACDHVSFRIDAALAGLGIALLPMFMAVPHVASGAFVQVLPRYSMTIELQLVTHHARRMPHRVTLLRSSLIEYLSGACSKHG